MPLSLAQVRHELNLLHCEENDGTLVINRKFQNQGCPYCSIVDASPHINPNLTKGLNYVRCRRCGLVYPLPRLNHDALDQRVDAPLLNEYFTLSLAGTGEVVCREYKEIDFLDRVCRFTAERGYGVLEVGCGSGSFLKGLVEKGCVAIGVEPNTALATFCRRQGLTVIKDFFRPGLPLDRNFDLIVFRESLYHLFNVKEALALARELLRDRGWLYVKAFNVDSPAIWYLRRASGGINGLDIPANFSPGSLTWILKDAGFEPQETIYFPDNMCAFIGVKRDIPLLNQLLSVPLQALGISRNFGMLARKLADFPGGK